ncbi:hypothetical protein SNEBB_003027 [Seison nebaliae]|nr:hypothetical protein SNEBB_003027 [Seison nebaliae]
MNFKLIVFFYILISTTSCIGKTKPWWSILLYHNSINHNPYLFEQQICQPTDMFLKRYHQLSNKNSKLNDRFIVRNVRQSSKVHSLVKDSRILPSQIRMIVENYFLLSPFQFELLCEKSNKLLGSIKSVDRFPPKNVWANLLVDSVAWAVNHCQRLWEQFGRMRSMRSINDESVTWNCQIFNSSDLFGEILYRNSKELVFINSILTSSVMHTLMEYCKQQKLNDLCGSCLTTSSQYQDVYQDSLLIPEITCSDDLKFIKRFVHAFFQDMYTEQKTMFKQIYKQHKNHLYMKEITKELEEKEHLHLLSRHFKKNEVNGRKEMNMPYRVKRQKNSRIFIRNRKYSDSSTFGKNRQQSFKRKRSPPSILLGNIKKMVNIKSVLTTYIERRIQEAEMNLHNIELANKELLSMTTVNCSCVQSLRLFDTMKTNDTLMKYNEYIEPFSYDDSGFDCPNDQMKCFLQSPSFELIANSLMERTINSYHVRLSHRLRLRQKVIPKGRLMMKRGMLRRPRSENRRQLVRFAQIFAIRFNWARKDESMKRNKRNELDNVRDEFIYFEESKTMNVKEHSCGKPSLDMHRYMYKKKNKRKESSEIIVRNHRINERTYRHNNVNHLKSNSRKGKEKKKFGRIVIRNRQNLHRLRQHVRQRRNIDSVHVFENVTEILFHNHSMREGNSSTTLTRKHRTKRKIDDKEMKIYFTDGKPSVTLTSTSMVRSLRCIPRQFVRIQLIESINDREKFPLSKSNRVEIPICEDVCCGRGIISSYEHVEEECNCRFIWCCRYECEKCGRIRKVYKCL